MSESIRPPDAAPLPALEVLRRNPFRLFFPLGILFALIGVGEWVLWSLGWPMPAAGLLHASLQTQGFLTCFVAGFLMTALPRFTGAPSATLGEIGFAFAFALATLVALLARSFLAGQVLFGGWIAAVMVFGLRRLSKRTKPLPPSFLLVGFGFLHALTGTILMVTSGLGNGHVNPFIVGRQMIQLGFLLCMVLGITAQLAPFLMGYTNEPAREDGKAAVFRKGGCAMLVHGLVGAVLYATFWLIPCHERWAYVVRAAAATFHLLFYARMGRRVKKKSALIFFFTLSMWMILAGLWGTALVPAYRIAALHLVFIGGFSLMIFSFGQLVVLSHSGQAALLNGRLIPMKIVGAAVLLAMILRVSADLFGNAYMPLIHMSSGIWVLAAAFWLINLFPKMWRRSHSQS